LISYFGAIVRAELENPQFVKNEEKLAQMFRKAFQEGGFKKVSEEAKESPRSVALESNKSDEEDHLKDYKRQYQ